MNGTDIQITICGSAGDGAIAAGEILRKAAARVGYDVIGFDVYPAEIRGFGKCVARTRIAAEPVYSLKALSDVMVSLDDDHARGHVREVRDFGAVIHEGQPLTPAPEGRQMAEAIGAGQLPYRLNMRMLSERASKSARSRNIAALGFLAALYGLPPEAFHATLADKFRAKSGVVEAATAAFDAGFEQGRRTFKLDFIHFGPPAKEKRPGRARILTGNASLVRGALDAGVDAFFGYPITPASSILERLSAEMPKAGGRVLQTEDEISAIAAAIGAGYAGARAATATSGPGLALMVEMLGLGVMVEAACVVYVSQRGGPSTGLPTKTEQSDLNLAVYGASGDGRRLVVAPTNVAECYEIGGRAFELAEAFQTPVLVLLDLYLSNRSESVVLELETPFVANAVRGLGARDPDKPFMRYAAGEGFVSPRAAPGEVGGVHTITGLEHNAAGRPSDDPANHMAMSEKRHRKLEGAFDYPGVRICERFGDDGKVEVGVIAWGSTYGEAMEAVRHAREQGVRCAALKVMMLSPLPVDPIHAFMADCGKVLCPELNHQGQFADLITSRTGHRLSRLNGVTGEPMKVGDIADEIFRLAGRDGAALARPPSAAA